MKKLLSLLITLTLLATLLAFPVLAEGGYKPNAELDQSTPITLNVFGPGAFANEEGSTDLVSGLFKPGYNEIIARWHEIYPNVTLDITPASWDSWQSAITAAALSGDVDVIMHGATMTDLTEDLTPYLDKDPDYRDAIYATASRRTTQSPSVFKVSGISLTISPAVAWLDTEIFEHYGVELPSADWTYDDVLELAEKLTGIDPVTGEETYGLQMFEAGTSNLWMNYTLAANSVGAKIFNYGETLNDSTVNFLSPEAIKGFEIVEKLAKFASPESKEGVAVNSTLNGNNTWAMIFGQYAPSGHFQMKAANLEGRYVPYNVPYGTEGEYKGIPSPFAGDNNMAIYKDTDKKEWAWEFIKFMTTDEVAVQWVVNQMSWPNSKSGKQYAIELVGEDLARVMDTAFAALPENYNNATNDVFNNVSFGSVTNTLITAVDNVINGYMTPEEAAKSMQDYVDEYLASLK